MPPFPFTLLMSWQRCPPLLDARQPAKTPGGHINYIAAPPHFSHVYLWVCTDSDNANLVPLHPHCCRSTVKRMLTYTVYPWICTNAHIHVQTPCLFLGRSCMVGKSSQESTQLPQAQLYRRLRCVHAQCVCVCVFLGQVLWYDASTV